MPRRRYYDEDRAAAEFAAWALVLMGGGLLALLKALQPKPSAYQPVAPDDPTQMSTFQQLKTLGSKIDLSRAKLPKLDLSGEGPAVTWNPEDRPRLKAPDAGELSLTPVLLGSKSRTYRLHPGKQPPDLARGTRLMRTLLAACPRLTFEIVAEGSSTYWQVIDYEGRYKPAIILNHLRSHCPGAEVLEYKGEDHSQRGYPFFRQMLLFGLVNEYAAPLPFLEDLGEFDPLTAIAHRMDWVETEGEERIRYRLMTIVPSPEAQRRAGSRLVGGTVKPTSGIHRNPDDPVAGFDLKLLNTKLDDPLYHAFLSVLVESRDESRLDILSQVAQDVKLFSSPQHNGLNTVGAAAFRRAIQQPAEAGVSWFEIFLAALVQQQLPEWRQLLLVLSPRELASLWHLPHEDFGANRIVWAGVSIPRELTSPPKQAAEAVVLGEASSQGQTVPVYLTRYDRSYHHYITGKTGMGKSTLMHHLIQQDIRHGHGVAVIDPHGKLIHSLLETLPREREKEVVLLDCGQTDYPVPLNPFRLAAGISHDTAFNYLYWVLRKIYESIWLEGRTDLVMRNVLQALLCDPEATPLDIERLFTDERYRRQITDLMEAHEEASFATLRYWREFGKKSAGEVSQLAQPILHRTGAFLGNRALEYMTCHPHSLDFTSLVGENKIVLVNLSGNAIRSEIGSLGAIFLAGFYLASEHLGFAADAAPPRFYLYIDEVERLITTPIPDMFAQARKFGLSLTLANQFLDQLPRETLQSIVGNVGSQFIFEIGQPDTSTFAPAVEPDLGREHLLNLGAYHMAVKTRARGRTMPAFIAKTYPPPQARKKPVSAEAIFQHQHFLPKKEVDAWLKQRYSTPPTPVPEVEAKPKRKAASRSKTGAKPKAEEKAKRSRKSSSSDGLKDYE